MTWVAAADYRRANRVRERNQYPCQVYGKVDHVSADLMVGAIATGAADASLSHVGAKIAARAAVSHVRQSASQGRRAISDSSGEAAHALYSEIVDAVLEEPDIRVQGAQAFASSWA